MEQAPEPQDVKPPKEGAESPDEIITVKLLAQDGSSPVDIRAKRKTKVERLAQAWAKQRGIAQNAIRLYIDGNRININQTLLEAKIEDGDQIDVVLQQVGGHD